MKNHNPQKLFLVMNGPKDESFAFTPLESPGIYAGDVINRKRQLLVKAGSKPHLSNGVYLFNE